jgi:uncharacterized protein (DUF169 family)
MKNENVRQASIILNLTKKIIGVKFIDFKEDYDALEVPEAEKMGSICFHARQAMEGNLFKFVKEKVSCDYGRFALGLTKPDTTIVEGRSFEYCGLTETTAIGKNIVASMKYIDHISYGVSMGPLDEMKDADLVIIADYAETIMRVMQGYAYKYGDAKQLSFFGNQAMCADLISKPFSNHDINISLMCRGARAYGRFEKGELGVSVPIALFDNLVDGIVKTFTPVANRVEKQRVIDAIGPDDVLHESIDLDYNYGMGLKEYDNRVAALRKENQ